MKNKFKVLNRISQPILLTNGIVIKERDFVILDDLLEQVINLEKRGFVIVRKV